MDIKVNVRESEGDAYVVDLTGEIDVYTSPKVKDAITELQANGTQKALMQKNGIDPTLAIPVEIGR